jgi:hypothetical protein
MTQPAAPNLSRLRAVRASRGTGILLQLHLGPKLGLPLRPVQIHRIPLGPWPRPDEAAPGFGWLDGRGERLPPGSDGGSPPHTLLIRGAGSAAVPIHQAEAWASLALPVPWGIRYQGPDEAAERALARAEALAPDAAELGVTISTLEPLIERLVDDLSAPPQRLPGLDATEGALDRLLREAEAPAIAAWLGLAIEDPEPPGDPGHAVLYLLRGHWAVELGDRGLEDLPLLGHARLLRAPEPAGGPDDPPVEIETMDGQPVVELLLPAVATLAPSAPPRLRAEGSSTPPVPTEPRRVEQMVRTEPMPRTAPPKATPAAPVQPAPPSPRERRRLPIRVPLTIVAIGLTCLVLWWMFLRPAPDQAPAAPTIAPSREQPRRVVTRKAGVDPTSPAAAPRAEEAEPPYVPPPPPESEEVQALRAQARERARQQIPEHAEQAVAQIATQVDLDKEEYGQLVALLQREYEQAFDLMTTMDPSSSGPERIQWIRTETDERAREILDDEQFEAYRFQRGLTP